MGIIKYKRAKNNNGEIVNIEEVTPEIRKATKFTCISCGQELSACLGNKNQHHFRHKTEVDCNLETYLHKMGKFTFVKAYSECLAKGNPFIITLKRKVSCVKEGNCPVRHYYGSYPDVCNTYGWEDFDLTQYYDSVAEEQTVGSYVAEKQSGYRIIEIELHKEEDLELIESCQLRQSEPAERDYYLDTDSRNTRRNY